jgi:aspartyl-tRNA(Asn)/glutamyl-tRNA(Gln) amidotransferase subunit A
MTPRTAPRGPPRPASRPPACAARRSASTGARSTASTPTSPPRSRALTTFADAGAELVDVALPDPDEALTAYVALTTAEAASNLARYDGARFGLHVPRDSFEATAAATRAAGFGPEVKRRIVLGTLLQRSPELLARARAARARVAAAHADALARCDALAGPTAAEPAGLIGHAHGDSLDRHLVAAALAGLPALSLPCGLTRATAARPSLPIGLHLVGAALGEPRLLALAADYEARRGPLPEAPS